MSRKLISLDEAVKGLKYWIKPSINDSNSDIFDKLGKFAEKKGQHLSEELAEQFEQSENWAFDMLSRRFLYNHKSLPITSNYTVKIDWRTTQTGLKKVAHFVNAFLHINAKYLKGEEIAIDHYDNNLEIKNKLLRFLGGSCRRPSMPYDELYFNTEKEPVDRDIVVLFKGHAWKITVIDDKFGIANPAQIENVLYELLQTTTETADIPFTIPSVINTEMSLKIRKQLLCRDENHKIMQVVENALFVLSLDDTHYSDDEEALFESSYGEGMQVWGYKQLNFVCSVADGRFFAQIEGSTMDVNVLRELLKQARSIFEGGSINRKNLLKPNLGVKPINWTIDGRKIVSDSSRHEFEGTYKIMSDAWQEYQYSAEKWFVSLHDVFITDDEEKKVANYDRNALSQLLLQYAQYSVYHKLYSMVEYVDLSDLRDYCYDYMPQITKESEFFVQKLYNKKATFNDLEQAINAYSKRRKMVREGKGVWGYWLAMQYMADKNEENANIFNEDTVMQLMNPSLSVMYLDSSIINQMVIPPHNKKGLGIFCFSKRNHFNFVITHPRHHINEIRSFSKAITSALKQILQIL